MSDWGVTKEPWYKDIVVWIGGVAGVIGIAIVTRFFDYFGYEPSNNVGNWGAFGDYVGGLLNPMFGFMSLLLLVVTLKQNKEALKNSEIALQQSREALTMNQKELELSRREMAASAEALRKQAELMDAQSETEELRFTRSLHHKSVEHALNKFLDAVYAEHRWFYPKTKTHAASIDCSFYSLGNLRISP
ncbi:hypothetical protein [Endozoicomonas arenosclerae]|uniref:hypothetical protein n=1 Tax=Endozoicomonas arenosclerae TaxID=1633495 RepID=UPI000781ABDD|nr:hypothetical protein [Endozoicomonas arenosclerae]